jgi:hypothetical protein
MIMCMYVYMCMCATVCVCVCVFICMCVCLCVYVCIAGEPCPVASMDSLTFAAQCCSNINSDAYIRAEMELHNMKF